MWKFRTFLFASDFNLSKYAKKYKHEKFPLQINCKFYNRKKASFFMFSNVFALAAF